jgi:hypothetical protein
MKFIYATVLFPFIYFGAYLWGQSTSGISVRIGMGIIRPDINCLNRRFTALNYPEAYATLPAGAVEFVLRANDNWEGGFRFQSGRSGTKSKGGYQSETEIRMAKFMINRGIITTGKVRWGVSVGAESSSLAVTLTRNLPASLNFTQFLNGPNDPGYVSPGGKLITNALNLGGGIWMKFPVGKNLEIRALGEWYGGTKKYWQLNDQLLKDSPKTGIHYWNTYIMLGWNFN